MDPAREIWGLFLDPVLDLLKSHVLAHYAEHRLTSSQASRTAEGERLVRELDESLSHPPDSLSRLSPDEKEQLLRLLSKAFGPNS